MKPIALLTDFGTKDWFVASMKGVILSINPAAVIVEITHDIPAGDIAAGVRENVAAAGPTKIVDHERGQ